MAAVSLLMCVLVAALVQDSIQAAPQPGDWDRITIKPPFPTISLPTFTLPTFTLPTLPPPPRRCSAIRNRLECIKTKPCPEGTRSSFCYWIPFPHFPPTIGPPIYQIEKRDTANELENDATDNEGQFNEEDADMEKRAAIPIPYPNPIPRPIPFPFGRCACCTPTYCKPPKVFNRATCRCQCPKGTKENARGQCVGDCEKIQDLNGCPKIYCADNPHFLCKRVGYQCKCPSCDAASERDWCVRTKCLEQPQKLKCVFDSETYKCRCPMCMDQNGDRPWCLMTYCGMNNHVKCRWESYWRKCFCPIGD